MIGNSSQTIFIARWAITAGECYSRLAVLSGFPPISLVDMLHTTDATGGRFGS
jgi:hypothetical protein